MALPIGFTLIKELYRPIREAGIPLHLVLGNHDHRENFYGHSHRWKFRREKEIHLVNVPATAWLFDANEPRGWLDVTFQKAGAAVVMNALDKKHAKHGERLALKWRA